MSQFAFLQREWPAVLDAAARTEAAVYADPRTACFYARRALELAVSWAYKHDAALRLPYQDNRSALIHEPSFKQTVGEAVFGRARVINTLGNRAVHGHRAVPEADAVAAVRELFHVAYWLARTYGRMERPAPGLAFDVAVLPRPVAAAPQPVEQAAAAGSQPARARREARGAALGPDRLDEELTRLRAEVAAAVNLIVDHLTEHGIVEPGRLYESPFTDLTPRGPDELFSAAELDELLRSLEAVRATAVAA